MHRIKIYKEYKGVMIFQDYNVADDEQVYIGNGQGCGTFWFRDIKEAKKFIDKYRDKMKIWDTGVIRGLIPEKLCRNCKCHYSYQTPKWYKAKERNCQEFKEQLKNQIRYPSGASTLEKDKKTGKVKKVDFLAKLLSL